MQTIANTFPSYFIRSQSLSFCLSVFLPLCLSVCLSLSLSYFFLSSPSLFMSLCFPLSLFHTFLLLHFICMAPLPLLSFSPSLIVSNLLNLISHDNPPYPTLAIFLLVTSSLCFLFLFQSIPSHL